MKQMKYIILACSFLFFGCSSDKVVYVDSNTGKAIPQKVKLQKFTQEVVCNEFGVAYYKSSNECGNDIYTPVLTDNHNGFRQSNEVTCEEYEEL
jgi:hypothetical protein